MVEFLDGPKLFVIREFLSPPECDGFIERSEQLGFADAPITSSAGFLIRKDIRDNARVVLDSPSLAAEWWERAKPLLVEDWFGWKVAGLIGCPEKAASQKAPRPLEPRRHLDHEHGLRTA